MKIRFFSFRYNRDKNISNPGFTPPFSVVDFLGSASEKIILPFGHGINTNKRAGFTLIELIASLAIFVILASGVLSGIMALSRATKTAREKTVLSSLASNYLEIVRNMPYSAVGTVSGNPRGALADYPNAIEEKIEGAGYKIYYEVTYVDDPADGTIGGTPDDPAPADYKQVKMNIQNGLTGSITDFLTTVVPKGQEGLQDGGAIKIMVFNKIGQSVSDADIEILHPAGSPAMMLYRKSDTSGQWVEVGLPPDTNNYRIMVTKPGFTSDRTYPITVQNPNPLNPDVTVEAGKVALVPFAIDLLSNLTIKTLNNICQPISGIDVNIRGEKLIGDPPPVLKFNQDFTSADGEIALTDIEWDTYTPTLLTGQEPYVVRGTSPIQKINVEPGTSQTYTMILGENITTYSLLVIVKDANSRTALEGAQIHLRKGGSVPQDYYGTSGGSIWSQNDWTGGSGQTNWSEGFYDRYFSDDGNVDINSVPTGVRLRKESGRYLPAGWLESSIFDTGSGSSDFTTISWTPSGQESLTLLQFQLATSNDPAGPWNYIGPDGTDGSFYEVPGTNINTTHDDSRYIRYKVFLSTGDDRNTPELTSLQINYVSGCSTPGQYWFSDLTSGENYSLEVSLSGYQAFLDSSFNITGHNTIDVELNPQ